MNINETKLKFSTACAIEPQKYELGQDVEFTVKGTIVKEEHRDTQEGTMDVIYVVKVTEVI